MGARVPGMDSGPWQSNPGNAPESAPTYTDTHDYPNYQGPEVPDVYQQLTPEALERDHARRTRSLVTQFAAAVAEQYQPEVVEVADHGWSDRQERAFQVVSGEVPVIGEGTFIDKSPITPDDIDMSTLDQMKADQMEVQATHMKPESLTKRVLRRLAGQQDHPTDVTSQPEPLEFISVLETYGDTERPTTELDYGYDPYDTDMDEIETYYADEEADEDDGYIGRHFSGAYDDEDEEEPHWTMASVVPPAPILKPTIESVPVYLPADEQAPQSTPEKAQHMRQKRTGGIVGGLAVAAYVKGAGIVRGAKEWFVTEESGERKVNKRRVAVAAGATAVAAALIAWRTGHMPSFRLAEHADRSDNVPHKSKGSTTTTVIHHHETPTTTVSPTDVGAPRHPIDTPIASAPEVHMPEVHHVPTGNWVAQDGDYPWDVFTRNGSDYTDAVHRMQAQGTALQIHNAGTVHEWIEINGRSDTQYVVDQLLAAK